MQRAKLLVFNDKKIEGHLVLEFTKWDSVDLDAVYRHIRHYNERTSVMHLVSRDKDQKSIIKRETIMIYSRLNLSYHKWSTRPGMTITSWEWGNHGKVKYFQWRWSLQCVIWLQRWFTGYLVFISRVCSLSDWKILSWKRDKIYSRDSRLAKVVCWGSF